MLSENANYIVWVGNRFPESAREKIETGVHGWLLPGILAGIKRSLF
jgi:hypothetical protein